MDCDTAREALSARIDGEREPIPAVRVDEHLAGCAPCRQWQAERVSGRSVSWRRWALGAVGLVQVGLAVAQGLGAELGVPHEAGHVLNESTAWSAALGVVMLAAAIRPVMAGGLSWVLVAFVGFLALYEITDTDAGREGIDRPLTHLPIVAGAALALLVWRKDRTVDGPPPDAVVDDIVLPENASRGRRRGHLSSSDGSAA